MDPVSGLSQRVSIASNQPDAPQAQADEVGRKKATLEVEHPHSPQAESHNIIHMHMSRRNWQIAQCRKFHPWKHVLVLSSLKDPEGMIILSSMNRHSSLSNLSY